MKLPALLYPFLCLTIIFTSLGGFTQTPCEEGFAGVYPCNQVDLMAHLLPEEVGGGSMNDVWGWTDPEDGKEYVLLGRSSGVSFIDISNPLNPVYLGDLPTHTFNSSWRDVKVYENYAFVVSEAANHGMQVFDLTKLRNVDNPPVTFEEDAHYDLFGDAHNIAINTTSGFAYAVGTNTFSGGLHIINIQDPLNPLIAGDFSEDGYTHDAQIVIYNGPDTEHLGKDIAFAANENSLTIVDCEDKTDCIQLSRSEYEGSEYTHQGWLTEDHRFFLLGDELDETGNGHNTKTMIWNVEDLDNPFLVASYFAGTSAIDHNQYVNGNLLFQSNYRAGLRILDLQEVESGELSEAAFFDVYPADDNTGFDGTWSNYPFFQSGVVPVSHIGEGLFLVKPRFLNLAQDTVQFCSQENAIVSGSLAAGFEGPISLSVSGEPEGAEVEFSNESLVAPADFTISLNNFPAGETHTIYLTATGANFAYEDSLTITVNPSNTYYADNDEDGYGNEQNSIEACDQPTGYVQNADDCNDDNVNVHPGAAGTMEGIDNNCDGQLDENELEFCAGDFDDNLQIATADLLIMLSEFGCLADCQTDLDNSGNVSTGDLLIFLSLFGDECN